MMMLLELRALGVEQAGAPRVNGKRMSARELAELGDAVDRIEALDGPVLLEVERIVEEDWTAFRSGLPVSVQLENAGDGLARTRLGIGHRLQFKRLARAFEKHCLHARTLLRSWLSNSGFAACIDTLRPKGHATRGVIS